MGAAAEITEVDVQGSYNFSEHVGTNDESLLMLDSPGLAVTYGSGCGAAIRAYAH